MKSKHTKGVVKFNEYGKIITASNSTLVTSGVMITGRGDEEPEANAQLIADTFNVTNETNKTPRELQKSHDELLDALEGMRNQFKGKETNGFLERLSISNAEQAIKNATK